MCKKLISALLLLTTSLPLLAGELEERVEYDKRFSTMFMQEQFDALDKLAAEYRATESRSSSGLWMLTHFYFGIRTVTNHGKDEKYWAEVESKALRWVASNPQSPASINVYASFLIEHGWKYRGSGLAHQVRKEDWKPFYEKLSQAREYLLLNKRIASADPRWYENMLIIARAEGWKRNKFDELVTEAVSKHPYFYQIYFAALDYLVPKWHGSREEIEKFANFAVEHTKAGEGMGMYARVYWYASQTYYNADLIESDIDWDKMKRGIDDVLARYPDQWNINNFAFFACLGGDKQKTAELINRISTYPIHLAWGNHVYRYYDRCKAWTSTSARLIYSDTELRNRLVGNWQEVRLFENDGEVHQHNISLKNDGTIEVFGAQYYAKQQSSIKFNWRGNWGVKDGVFWYTATFSDQPQLFPVGEQLADQIVSVSDEWVMIEQSTGNKSRARRVIEKSKTGEGRAQQ